MVEVRLGVPSPRFVETTRSVARRAPSSITEIDMKTILAFLFVVIANSAFAQYTKDNLAMGDKSTFQNLQLYPVKANKTFQERHKSIGKYTTLQQGLKQNKVKISESSDGGEVNKLFIENVSKDTIMVLAGEVVQGGKQDRVISNDFVLYPKSGKKDLDVFCVEHGRWVQNGTGGEFKDYFTISSNSVRKAAAVEKEQGNVWEKVAEINKKNEVKTSTGALTAAKDADKLNAQLKNYKNWFASSFRDQPDVIGIVAVSGKKVLGCDMFATHEMFMSYYPNLLDSYATEAITSGGPVTASYAEVSKFLMDLISNEAAQEDTLRNSGTMLKENGKKYHISKFQK